MQFRRRKDRAMVLILASFLSGVIVVSLLSYFENHPDERGRPVQTHIQRESNDAGHVLQHHKLSLAVDRGRKR